MSMVDFGVYWPFFSKRDEDWPVDGWRVGKGSRLAAVSAGDRLWLFTSGKKCKQKVEGEGFAHDAIAEAAAYLTQILTVKNIEPDCADGFDVLINANVMCSPKVFPPLLIDHLVRPEGADATVSIGTFRQAPWRLGESTALLLELLRRERSQVFQAIEGR
jgi:hypothetical protein